VAAKILLQSWEVTVARRQIPLI